MLRSVGLNLLFLGERAGGIGRYARGLLDGFAQLEQPPELTVFAGRDLPADLRRAPWAGEVEWVDVPVSVQSPVHLPAQMAALPILARRRRLQVLHSPANVGPLVLPGMANVVTVHDLIWLHHAEDWDPRARVRLSTRTLTVRSLRAADRVIAPSRATRDDFVATVGVEAEKVDVTPLAAGEGLAADPMPEPEVRRRYGLGQAPLVLSVAQKRPYKRLDTLVRAVADLSDTGAVLVLVGPATPHEEELRRLAADLEVDERVRFLDWVEDGELETLYRACACFALPSLIEGFGLPVLEAMQRGAPVVCSDRGSLPEVAGDAALLVDPNDQQRVTAALSRLLSDEQLRRELAERGRERSAGFTWRRTAQATVACYERALRRS